MIKQKITMNKLKKKYYIFMDHTFYHLGDWCFTINFWWPYHYFMRISLDFDEKAGWVLWKSVD